MSQTDSPSITTRITDVLCPRNTERTLVRIYMLLKGLTLKKPTHHITHAIYQPALSGSLNSTFSVPLLTFSGCHYTPFIHACFFFYPSGSLFQLFPLACFFPNSIPLLPLDLHCTSHTSTTFFFSHKVFFFLFLCSVCHTFISCSQGAIAPIVSSVFGIIRTVDSRSLPT